MSPNCRARLRPGSPACTTCSRPGTTSTGLEAAWPQVKCHRGRLGGWMPIANDALWAAATDGDDAGDASKSLIRAGGAHLLCSHLPWLRLPHLQARRGPGTGSRVRIPSPPPPTSSTQHTTSLTLPARPRPSTAWRPPGTSTSSRPALSACGPGRAGSAPSSCRSCANASVSGRALIWLGSPSTRSRVVSYGSTLAWIVPYRLLHVLQVCRASQPMCKAHISPASLHCHLSSASAAYKTIAPSKAAARASASVSPGLPASSQEYSYSANYDVANFAEAEATCQKQCAHLVTYTSFQDQVRLLLLALLTDSAARFTLQVGRHLE